MKNILYIIILFLNLSFAQAIETKIIHNIQNEIITNVDIKNEFKYLLALNKKLEELDKEKILNIANDSIIREKIKKTELLNHFEKIKVNIEYLNLILENLYTRRGLKSLREFEAHLKNYGLTINDIEEKIAIDALWNQLIVKKYSPQLEIDQEKIKKQIENDPSYKKKEYQLSEILFEIKNKEEIKTKYKEIIKSVNEIGFENTASIFSFAESSKIGGDIGWVNEKSLNNKTKESIINLKIGEISNPIILPNGILLLKLKNIKNSVIKTDYKLELTKAINYEKSRQLDQYSKIYFNKIKKNLEFNE